MSPQRWNGHETHGRHELRLVLRVAEREVEIRLRRHVEKGHLDGTERTLDVAPEPWRRPDIVLLPGPRLQDHVVRVRARKEVAAKGLHVLLERRAGRGVRL